MPAHSTNLHVGRLMIEAFMRPKPQRKVPSFLSRYQSCTGLYESSRICASRLTKPPIGILLLIPQAETTCGVPMTWNSIFTLRTHLKIVKPHPSTVTAAQRRPHLTLSCFEQQHRSGAPSPRVPSPHLLRSLLFQEINQKDWPLDWVECWAEHRHPMSKSHLTNICQNVNPGTIAAIGGFRTVLRRLPYCL